MITPSVAELIKQAKAEKWVNPHDMLRRYPDRRYLTILTGWGGNNEDKHYVVKTKNTTGSGADWGSKKAREVAVLWDQLGGSWAPVTFNKMTTWIEVDPSDPAGGGRPCARTMMSSFSSHQCERPAIPDDPQRRCKVHFAADKRSDDNLARYRERWAEQDERADRARQIANGLKDDWNEVCELLGIVHRGDPPSPFSTSRVTVDSEVLGTFLRQLKRMLD